MKKIISVILGTIFISINCMGIIYAQVSTDIENDIINTVTDIEPTEEQTTNTNNTNEETNETDTTTNTNTNTLINPQDPKSVMGITCTEEMLLNGQCKLNIYDTLGIRKSVRDQDDATSVGLFVQDVVLSATFFIGTVVTIALIVSGIMFIFAASSGKDPANAKKGIIGSLIGLLLVVSSYVIIRLVQYLAKGF